MPALATWKFISNKMQENIPVILLYVVESHGSSPGREGFLMAVDSLGAMQGSIGGGIMEHKFVEMAKDKLTHFATETDLRKQVHNKIASNNQSGMICSGEQTIVLYRLQKEDLLTVNRIIKILENYKTGIITLLPYSISFTATTQAATSVFSFIDENQWNYSGPVLVPRHLFIVGGGHCSLALSKIMHLLGFRITVLEERKNLNTFENNSWAIEKIIVDGYENVSPYFTQHLAETYVVVMTFGYRTDEQVLKQIMEIPFKYLGVMGSKTKMQKMFDNLYLQGMSQDFLDAVHTPVGLPINSRTPEEIAISIAAQIIQVKNRA